MYYKPSIEGFFMGLQFRTGDVTDITSGIVIHGTNCCGGFGSGVAGAIRKKWPTVRDEFLKNVKHSDVDKQAQLGTIQTVKISDNLFVVNCYTQKYFGNDGKIYASTTAIEKCLEHVKTLSKSLQLPIYSVKLGSGLGGLSWNDDVLPIFENIFSDEKNINVIIMDINKT